MPFTTLITVDALTQHYSECLVIDCRFSLSDETLGEQHYLAGHLPQARYANLNTQLSSAITPQSGRHPLPDFTQLAKLIAHWGISNDSQVVLYDDIGGGFAARLWWLLRTLGHHKVALLDGGIDAWRKAEMPLETDLAKVSPAVFKAQLDQTAWVETKPLMAQLENKKCLLVDARDKPRFDGIEEPIDPIAGHIPGAINLPVSDNLNAQGYFQSAATLKARYAPLAQERAPEQIIHSCGSGVFACLGVLAMEIAGFSGSKIYAGSWSEWIRDASRPVEPRRDA